MSKGVYTIIDSFVGKQERFLTDTERLKNRLEEVYLKNLEDTTETDSSGSSRATIYDIIPTHEFYFKTFYKPFVACAHDYFKINSSFASSHVITNDGLKIEFALKDLNGDFINDQVLHIKFAEIGTPAPQSDQNLPNNPYPALRYKYCDLPGIRALKSVTLYANELIIDQYNTEDLLLYYKTRLDSNKQPAWNVMIGQEQIKQGQYYNRDYFINQIMQFTDGAQTAQPYQPELNLWIPLIFDYNLDVGRSLHNALLRSQQLRLVVELAPLDKLLQALDINDNVVLSAVQSHQITESSLYTKNIYLPPEINDLFTSRDNLSLIRVFRRQEKILRTNAESILLSGIKYPVEALTFGFRPTGNNTNTHCAFAKWYKFSAVTQRCFPVPAIINYTPSAPVQRLVARTARYSTETPVVNTLALKLHGNYLYLPTPEEFFADYTFATYPDMVSSKSTGIYFISFAHYPLKYNPSGYINMDTAREIYLAYTSSYISATNQVSMYISAKCINMLLYSDNYIKLKYI